MKIFDVWNDETGYSAQFYRLSDAKKAMKEHGAKGCITKVWSNGDWENLGEITLKGQNRTFVANTRQTKAGY